MSTKEDLLTFFNETEVEASSGLKVTFDILVAIATIIGLLSNAFVFYMVCLNKSMRSRTNMIMANWAVSDAISTIMAPLLTRFFLHPDDTAMCVVVNSKHIFAINCLLLFFVLNTKLSYYITCAVQYSMTLIFILANIELCIRDSVQRIHLTYVVAFIVLLCTIVLSLVADVYLNVKTKQHDDETKFKHALDRINYSSWIFFIAIFFLDRMCDTYLFKELLDFLPPLVSVILINFMYKRDKKINKCLKNAIRCKTTTFDEDAGGNEKGEHLNELISTSVQ